ncbi:unnamed protein product [Lampetra fluviatilis]
MAGERDGKQDLERVGEPDGERDGEEDSALLDSLQLPQESVKEWQARRRFLAQNLERFRGDDLDRLVSLSMVWVNHIFLGCRYNSELMKKVTEMAKGIEVDQGPKFNQQQQQALKQQQALHLQALKQQQQQLQQALKQQPQQQAVKQEPQQQPLDQEQQQLQQALKQQQQQQAVKQEPQQLQQALKQQQQQAVKQQQQQAVKQEPQQLQQALKQQQQQQAVKQEPQQQAVNLRQSPFSSSIIAGKQAIFTRLHKVVKRILHEEGGFRSELNFSKLFTAAAQESGCNPEYTYVELSRLAPADLPKDRQLPTQGYACELRCRLIYLATGYSGSKNGARDRATQRALSLFLRDSVHVQQVTRHRSSILLRRGGNNGAAPSANPGFGSVEHDAAMHDLVLNDRSEPARPDLPPALSDPFCDPAPKTRNVPAAAAAPPKQLTMHQQRCGGQWHGRGSTLREFVVLDNADNPVCVLNNSAQFNRTDVEFRFEPLQMDSSGVFHWCCSLYIGGDFVTSAVGPKKAVKQTVAEQGLEFLRQTRPTITPTANGNAGNVAQGPTVSRRDIMRRGGGERLSEDNVGSQLMRKMGWTGGGIGAAGREGISEPITVHQRMAREGLGTSQDSAVTARSVEEVIREYAVSSRQDELTFSSELTLDERKCVHLVAARYNLRSKSYWRDGRRHLVLRRRMHRDDIMRELERDGQVGRYILHQPGPTMKHS